jgi:pyruvate,water dikinase
VRTVGEAKKCLKIMEEERLKRSSNFKIWLMAEVPSFAFIIDEFNELPIDGYSIGSNDLCQFVLAVGRDNTTLAKLGYFDERDSAVMKAMEMIVKGAKQGGKTCSICGESVSNYREILEKLLKLGITSVSVNPDAVKETTKIVAKYEKEHLK